MYISPTFTIFSALQKALTPLVDNPGDFRGMDQLGFPFSYVDKRFQVLVKGDSDMLGNRNHMVLLLENLLNNAVYYADQKSTAKRYSRVTILLSRRQDQIVLEVYNRGPRIKDKDRSKIFQLGYSSRRIRDHHGKGLGLYFVNEICKVEKCFGGDTASVEADTARVLFVIDQGNRETEFGGTESGSVATGAGTDDQ